MVRFASIAVLFATAQDSAWAGSGQKGALTKREFMSNMEKAFAENNLPMNTEKTQQLLRKNLIANGIFRESPTNNDIPTAFMSESRELDEADYTSTTATFDLASYSMKYQGCSMLSSYSDDKAYANASSVMATEPFVSFRLCPAATCSDSTKNGCGYNYGEYLLPMSDYIKSFATYRKEVIQQLCNYCDSCDYYDTYFYANGNNRNLEDGNNGGGHACKNYDACSGYDDVCTGDDDDDDANEDEDAFSCSYVGSGGGEHYYVAPYCDGSAIKMGLFKDKYCTKHTGDDYDVSKILGFSDTDYDWTRMYSGDCMSCNKADLPWSVAGYNDGEAEALDFCEVLYDSAAKCEHHMKQDSGSVAYQSVLGLNQEKDTECLFVESVEYGSYDENGIVLVPGEERQVDYKYASRTVVGAISIAGSGIGGRKFFQIAALVVLIGGCFFFGVASFQLQRRLIWNQRRTQFLSQKNGTSKAVPEPTNNKPLSSQRDRTKDEDDRILGLRARSYDMT